MQTCKYPFQHTDRSVVAGSEEGPDLVLAGEEEGRLAAVSSRVVSVGLTEKVSLSRAGAGNGVSQVGTERGER